MPGAKLACLNLRHLQIFFFWMGLTYSSFAFSQSQSHSSTIDNNSISSADKVAQLILESLPDSRLQKGLERYYQILSPKDVVDDNDIAIQNSGISRHFERQFRNNSCFARQALLFYRDIRLNTRRSQKNQTVEQRHSRPSIGDTAGSSRPDLPAGWLFKKALTYTQGNPNAALTLIGLCGHDDKKQGNFKNASVETALQQEGYKRTDLFEIHTDESFTETLCPEQTSDFYLARSLSEKADISEQLKQKILITQYPGKTNLQVASKNYHVLGAAFMTCQMIEAGMPPFLAVQVETKVASIYRGIRLCQDIEAPAQLFWQLQNHKEIRGRPHQEKFEEAVVRLALERGRQSFCSSKSTENKDPICELLNRTGTLLSSKNTQLDKMTIASLNTFLDKVIASGLYSSWHINGEIAGVTLPCSRDQLLGPHPFLKWLVSQKQWPLNICGRGLSNETCRKALHTIKTWEVDFDWTISQHKVGAEFAASVCTRLPEGTNSFDPLCPNEKK